MSISCKNGGVCVVEMGYVLWKCGVCISVAKMGVGVVEMWAMYISCKNGRMCCGNVGYVSVAEMGVCVVEMWGMYQLQKWGVCIAERGGMCYGNGGYVFISCRNGGMCCRNGGYVLWKCGVCISCRNGVEMYQLWMQKWGGVCVEEMWGMYQLLKWGYVL